MISTQTRPAQPSPDGTPSTNRGRRNALGAIVAQFSQALSSFLLSVVAVRSLSTSTYGVLALLLGSLVLATALMTGFVGDSLTVLDRADRRIRSSLQWWFVIIMVALFVVGLLATALSGTLALSDALLFGLALSVFTGEDTVRRVLMASLRFWSVVVVDIGYLVIAAVVLAVRQAQSGSLSLSDFLIALVAGQAFAAGLGMVLFPTHERRLVSMADPALRAVASFGGWRALQQTLRPTSLTLVRIMVIVVAGEASLGQLEAARLYMSPALLVVQGTGGFLLATYASDRHLSVRKAVRSADRTVLILVVASLTLGAVAALAAGKLGPVLTGGATEIDRTTVIGWALFAAAVATTMPYASLGAVRGRQAVVVGLRVLDTVASMCLVAVLLFAMDAAPTVVPYALALGGLVGAVLQRQIGLATRPAHARPRGRRATVGVQKTWAGYDSS